MKNWLTSLREQGRFDIAAAAPGAPTCEILFTGDFCPCGDMVERIASGQSEAILAELRSLLDSCDLTATNLEAPFTACDDRILKGGPNLKIDPAAFALMLAAKFDIAFLANNHIGDLGPDALLETMALLDRHGIRHVGAGRNLADARRPLVVEQKGIRIAFLNIAENEFGGATGERPGAATLDPVVNIGDIRRCADEYDLTVVVIHGGNEGNPIPSPRMRKTYRAFAEAGAAAVIGMHTHCPQGVELWKGIPIIYSLGDFYFECPWGGIDPDNFWWTGYAVKLSFAKTGALSLQVVPHTFAPNGTRIRRFDPTSAGQFYRYLAAISAISADETEATRYWEAWCATLGPGMMKMFHIPRLPISAIEGEEERKRAVAVRNLFSCEAHHEVLTTCLRLMEEDRLAQAAAFFPEIKKLQKADFEIIKKPGLSDLNKENR